MKHWSLIAALGMVAGGFYMLSSPVFPKPETSVELESLQRKTLALRDALMLYKREPEGFPESLSALVGDQIYSTEELKDLTSGVVVDYSPDLTSPEEIGSPLLTMRSTNHSASVMPTGELRFRNNEPTPNKPETKP